EVSCNLSKTGEERSRTGCRASRSSSQAESSLLLAPAVARLPSESIHESGRYTTCHKIRIAEDLLMHRNAGFNTLDDRRIQGSMHSLDRQVSGVMMNYQLGYQRVVKGWDE